MKHTKKSSMLRPAFIAVVIALVVIAAGSYVYIRESDNRQLQNEHNLQGNSVASAVGTSGSNVAEIGQVVVTSPSASSVLEVGKTYNITWTGENPAYPIHYLILMEKIFGRNVVKVYLGSVASTQQTFAFKVPSATLPGEDYQIYLDSAVDGSAIAGSQAFTIVAQN